MLVLRPLTAALAGNCKLGHDEAEAFDCFEGVALSR